MTTLTIKCPQCRKPTPWEDNPSRPFCSERCRTIDLGCWATEDYRIPAEKLPAEDENLIEFPRKD